MKTAREIVSEAKAESLYRPMSNVFFDAERCADKPDSSDPDRELICLEALQMLIQERIVAIQSVVNGKSSFEPPSSDPGTVAQVEEVVPNSSSGPDLRKSLQLLRQDLHSAAIGLFPSHDLRYAGRSDAYFDVVGRIDDILAGAQLIAALRQQNRSLCDALDAALAKRDNDRLGVP